MAAREMELKNEVESRLAADVTEDPEYASEKAGQSGIRVMVWTAEQRRLEDWIKSLAMEKIRCKGILAAADCISLLADESAEGYVLTVGLFEDEIRLYLSRNGRCIKQRISPFRAQVLYQEHMDQLVLEEIEEQIREVLKGKQASLRLLPMGFPDASLAADRLGHLMGMDCRVEEQLGQAFCPLMAGALAWEKRKTLKPVNLLSSLGEYRRRLTVATKFLPLFLSLILLLASFSYGKWMECQAQMLEKQEEVLESRLREQKQDLAGEGIFRDRGPSGEDFRILNEALLPGMEMEDFSYHRESGRLTVRFRMEDQQQAPEFMKVLREQNPSFRVEYGGWEWEEQGEDGLFIMTVHVCIGVDQHEKIDET